MTIKFLDEISNNSGGYQKFTPKEAPSDSNWYNTMFEKDKNDRNVYDNLIHSFSLSKLNGNNEKDPIEKIYNTAVRLAQEQNSDSKDHGDWETTERIDKNFNNLINSAKNDEMFKRANPDINLDEYSDTGLFGGDGHFSSGDNDYMLIGESGGQKYRNKHIRDKSGGDVLTDIGNVINGINYNIAKPISNIAKGPSEWAPILQNGLTPDSIMGAIEGLEDMGIGEAGKALAPFTLGISMPASIALDAGKNFLQNKSYFDKANTGVDPVTGADLTDKEKNLNATTGAASSILGTLLSVGGSGAVPFAKKAIQDDISTAIKNLSKDAIENTAKANVEKTVEEGAEEAIKDEAKTKFRDLSTGDKIKKIASPLFKTAANIALPVASGFSLYQEDDQAHPFTLASSDALENAALGLANKFSKGKLNNLVSLPMNAINVARGFYSAASRDQNDDRTNPVGLDDKFRKSYSPSQSKKNDTQWLYEYLTRKNNR